MTTLEKWHDIIETQANERLDEVLAEDCVFLSPIVHSSQQGRELTKFYLTAAMNVFNDSFHYVKEVTSDEHTVLEFVCEVDGVTINGVDIMTYNKQGLISEFKVMVRPMKAIDLMRNKMKAMLEQLA